MRRARMLSRERGTSCTSQTRLSSAHILGPHACLAALAKVMGLGCCGSKPRMASGKLRSTCQGRSRLHSGCAIYWPLSTSSHLCQRTMAHGMPLPLSLVANATIHSGFRIGPERILLASTLPSRLSNSKLSHTSIHYVMASTTAQQWTLPSFLSGHRLCGGTQSWRFPIQPSRWLAMGKFRQFVPPEHPVKQTGLVNGSSW
mmetsp:Transcript_5980/g.21879  ORF Transcript_5980/g.21879 Transcript_5980/m.21879 type:complete len:201 (+) Transcript_5980:1184-1786(+)